MVTGGAGLKIINRCMKHKHHIIPKYMGGSDDPSNLIELSVEDHAEAHRVLYEQHGNWQDEIAWKALSGQIGKEEAIKMAIILANKNRKVSNETKELLRIINLGKKHSEKTKLKMSITRKEKKCRIGLKHSEETKNKIRESGKGKTPWNKGKTGIYTKEQLEKLRLNSLGKKHSEETKKILSQKSKGNKARLGKKHSEEWKKQNSIIMKEIWQKRKLKKEINNG